MVSPTLPSHCGFSCKMQVRLFNRFLRECGADEHALVCHEDSVYGSVLRVNTEVIAPSYIAEKINGILHAFEFGDFGIELGSVIDGFLSCTDGTADVLNRALDVYRVGEFSNCMYTSRPHQLHPRRPPLHVRQT